MWGEANSWRDPDGPTIPPTIFDHAASRIREELRDRAGLDPTQVIALAAAQDLEREHQATLAEPVSQPAEVDATEPDLASPRGFDDPQCREQLHERLIAANVPEAAIEARTSPTSVRPGKPPRQRKRPSPPRPNRDHERGAAPVANCDASADRELQRRR